MSRIIVVKSDKCVGCNACVRVCPVSEAITTKVIENGHFITTVNENKCIACGKCISACSHNARDYIDDTQECMNRLAKDKIIILVSPAVKAAFPNKWIGILNWFKKKGCLVYDVSFGADICTWAHIRAIDSGKIDNFITQSCAAVVNYIEMYQPRLLANLSPIHSPVSCMAVYLKKYLHHTKPIAVLSPCIAQKSEIIETGLADYNITFKKLMKYFETNNIVIPANDESEFEYDFDGLQGQMGSVYSRPGGFRDNIWQHNPAVNISNSEGVNRIYSELEMYADMPETKRPKIFDVLSCEYGCNLGSASGTSRSMFDIMATMRDIEVKAKSGMKTGMFRSGEDRLFRKFDEELKLVDFTRTYRQAVIMPSPNKQQLDIAYERMGKHTREERNYNCHACGYNSCRDMAVAICHGLNTPENCIVHAKELLIARHSQLALQHEKLLDITEQCCAFSEELRNNVGKIIENMDIIGNSTKKSGKKARVVNDLLEEIIEFFDKNNSLDENGIRQMKNILVMTRTAFQSLDDGVNKTNISSDIISKSIAEIQALVDKIKNILNEVG